ncbi:MAG: IS200/IS605 family transposase [Akkermansiaceae bacterium]|nr:IS200/IS605 family transposase [Akkermansiaceae bacterium]
MPDHVHGFFRFDADRGMKGAIADWKRWTARQAGIVWQKGFFDHRLRSMDSLMEKRSYILLNPVRAGLAAEPDDWPYVYDCRQ